MIKISRVGYLNYFVYFKFVFQSELQQVKTHFHAILSMVKRRCSWLVFFSR